MAVRTKEEIMEILKTRIGDSTSDEDISFVEDVNDTFDEYERRSSDQTDWKKKYEENDSSWRTKYRDRFFQKDEPYEDTDSVKEEEKEEVKEKTTYEELFNEE